MTKRLNGLGAVEAFFIGASEYERHRERNPGLCMPNTGTGMSRRDARNVHDGSA
jgi:hypothetical protein